MAEMKAGDILNDTYEIVEEIGSGGGGIVYKARHLRLETDVVVKKIKEEVIGRIESRQEADILKKLKHPYLPRVYDFIETKSGVYTVMDYIQGEDLETAVKRHGKYSQKQVRKWAEQLGEALDYLHSQNPPIIHSDIKPANIMLTPDGDICLIDFNISLAMGGSMESAVGISAGFSPPEQYRDPVLYARITHNYTLQESLRLTRNGSRPSDAAEKKTELLIGGEEESGRTDLLQDEEERWEKTELLTGEEKEAGRTDLLRERKEEQEKTELLIGEEERKRMEPQRGADCRTDEHASRLPGYTQYIGRGIDARSDIYSLGMTLYFLLTGAQPSADFDEKFATGKMDIIISEGFEQILNKMTQVSPGERYQNGREFLYAVRNCYKLDRRYIRMHRKQRGMQAAALASLAVGIVLIFSGMYLMRREINADYVQCLQDAGEAAGQYDYETAQRMIDQAKEISVARVDAYAQEVYLLYLSERYEECIRLCQSDINAAPFIVETQEDEALFGDICYILGNAYMETADYDNARSALSMALQYNDQNGLYYRDYAITLAKLGQLEEAEIQLEAGIGLGLAQDSVYMAQGELAHVQGKYEEASQYLEQSIMVTDDMQMKKRAVLLCADVYKTMGGDGTDREIALLEQYAGQFEGNGNLVMKEYLAESYARKAQQDKESAEIYYQKALTLMAEIYEQGYVTYQLRENMAILYENMDRFNEAEDTLLQMAEDYPERYEVYKRLAMLEADRQQMKENVERDYRQMHEYYERAEELYSGEEQDMEMDMLEKMIEELRDGGWLD